ncbi:MAG: YafY family protein [Firmicutes bacterium]|nr:YafY family protein [Bacillota bacterium]MDY5531536.1 YafY family protein [Pumilibacteraceae bacterium]
MQNWVLYGIMMTLLIKKKASRRYLAEKYEVSERTISRYVDVLSEAGVPIYSLAGKEGGYAISDEYKLDKTLFSPEELRRIVTCVKAAPDDSIKSSVLDKLQYMSMRKNDDKYLLKNDTLVIDAASWTNPTAFRNKMTLINQAIENGTSLDIKYTDRYDISSTRRFDPYSLALKEGVWYAYGWCHARKDFRLFRLARISSIIVTDEVFEKHEGNVYDKLSGIFDDVTTVDLEIEFSSTVLGEIEEWLGSDAISEKGLQYVANATVYSGNILIKKLLSFGSSIKVVKPAAVKEELLIECKRILRNSDVE